MFKNRPAEAIDPRSDILGVHKNGLAEATNNPPGEVLGVHNDGAANEATNNPRGEVLRVRDGYDKLIDKTVGFMETAMGEMPHYEYLVMMDDDVYLRLDRLSEWLDKRVPQADEQGFYAGQVCTVYTGQCLFFMYRSTPPCSKGQRIFCASKAHSALQPLFAMLGTSNTLLITRWVPCETSTAFHGSDPFLAGRIGSG